MINPTQTGTATSTTAPKGVNIDPISGLLAAGVGAATNIYTTNKVNKTNKEIADKNNQANYKLWLEQNAYNTPSAQMTRLKQAGLNPNLIYGSGSTNTGNASPAPKMEGYTAQKLDLNPLQDMSKFANFKQTEAQTNNLQAQKGLMNQDSALKALELSNKGVKLARNKEELKQFKDLIPLSLDSAKESLRQQEIQTKSKLLDLKYTDQTVKNKIMESMYRANYVKEQLKGQKKINALNDIKLDLRKNGIETNDSVIFRFLNASPLGKAYEKFKYYKSLEKSKY